MWIYVTLIRYTFSADRIKRHRKFILNTSLYFVVDNRVGIQKCITHRTAANTSAHEISAEPTARALFFWAEKLKEFSWRKQGRMSDTIYSIPRQMNSHKNVNLKYSIWCWSRGSSVSTKTRLWADGLDERCSVLFSTASSPALRPTRSPIQWVPLEGKVAEREADHSPSSSTEVKNA
jgi:hypothetical protein